MGQAAATNRFWHVGRKEAELLHLAHDVLAKLTRHLAAALDRVLVRVHLALDEIPHRVDDELLLVAETEIHVFSLVMPLTARATPLILRQAQDEGILEDRKSTRLNSSH